MKVPELEKHLNLLFKEYETVFYQKLKEKYPNSLLSLEIIKKEIESDILSNQILCNTRSHLGQRIHHNNRIVLKRRNRFFFIFLLPNERPYFPFLLPTEIQTNREFKALKRVRKKNQEYSLKYKMNKRLTSVPKSKVLSHQKLMEEKEPQPINIKD